MSHLCWSPSTCWRRWWNKLPSFMWSADFFGAFKKRLKTQIVQMCVAHTRVRGVPPNRPFSSVLWNSSNKSLSDCWCFTVLPKTIWLCWSCEQFVFQLDLCELYINSYFIDSLFSLWESLRLTGEETQERTHHNGETLLLFKLVGLIKI